MATKASVGKPNVSGAVFVAPFGTTLPTTASAALNGSFKDLGYVSEDGVTNSNSPTSTEIKAWGGDVILTPYTGKADTFKFKLVGVLEPDVLAAVYGSDNVSGTMAAGLTVRANSKEAPPLVWVIDMILSDGEDTIAKRTVIPNGKITSISDIVYKDSEAVGYEVTITALPGDSTFGYDTHKEYYQKQTSTSSS